MKTKEELKELALKLSQDEFESLIEFYATKLVEEDDEGSYNKIGSAISQLLIFGTISNVEAMGILEKVKHVWWMTFEEMSDEERFTRDRSN